MNKDNRECILITGAAGFIGAHLAKEILKRNKSVRVVGFDNMNDYYDVSLKEYRISSIERIAEESCSEWHFIKADISNRKEVDDVFLEYSPDVVVNLAAQAGVRYSIENPEAYIESNIVGFFNILEACRHSYDGGKPGVRHLVYASSSSVYGQNDKLPYSTNDRVDSPVSLYAATKKSDELLAHAYSKLYDIPTTGLRFFTVYGPAGRPDMAYFGFTNKLLRGDNIEIYNYGHCKRDFTYIDDIVEGIISVMSESPKKSKGEDGLPIPPYSLYNIGNSSPVDLLEFVEILKDELIRANVLPSDYDFEGHIRLVPMQPGDVPMTYADVGPFEREFGFKPRTSLRDGIRRFAEWYRLYYFDSCITKEE